MNTKCMGRWLAAMIAALTLTLGAAQAKLPPLSGDQQAKAEEAKTKVAETAKKDAELLGQAQDRVVARYVNEQKAKGVSVKPTPLQAPAATPPATPPAKN